MADFGNDLMDKLKCSETYGSERRFRQEWVSTGVKDLLTLVVEDSDDAGLQEVETAFIDIAFE